MWYEFLPIQPFETKLVLADFLVGLRTKSDKYAASGAEMEKLLITENKLLFKIERKISEIPNQPNSLTENHVKNLRNALKRIESERNISKLISFVATSMLVTNFLH